MIFPRLMMFLLIANAGFAPAFLARAQTAPASATSKVAYPSLTAPQRILADAQTWEGKEFPHTLNVLELKRGGFRYWGWYGLNEGGGIGLARSSDLRNWIKYQQNPLWTNARWPSGL
jgi:hypothetical protein